MRKIFFLFAALLCLASCSDEILTDSDMATEEQCKPAVFEDLLKTIRISASSVENAPAGEGPSRTTLDGHSVLWDKGDKFIVVNPQTSGPSNKLQITIDGKGQGMGFEVSRTSSVQIKYSGIRVAINDHIVTDEILSAPEEVENDKNNDFLLGIPNSQDRYKYPTPETPVKNPVKSKYQIWPPKTFYGATLARSSSNSDYSPSKKAVITLQDIKYSTDGKKWDDINEYSSLLNGNKYFDDLKNVPSFTWLHSSDLVMTIDNNNGPGRTYGAFKGEASFDSDISDDAYAVFPYNAVKKYSDGKLTVTIPSTQSYKGDSFGNTANLMIGSLDEQEDGSYHVSFKNMCGVLQLKLKGDCDLSSISITDKGGKMLWGNVTIPADKIEEGISTDMISGGSSTITLDCDGEFLTDEEKVFDIVVPVGSFQNGMDVEVKSKGGQEFKMSTSLNNEISRNTIKKMPPFKVNLVDTYDLENEAVKLFFSFPHYQTYGEETSHFTDKTTAEALKDMYNHDTPEKVSLSWIGDASKTYTVSLTHMNDDGQSVTKNYSAKGTKYNADNLVPGKDYTYTVKDGEEIIKTCHFKTAGLVRMVTIDVSWNCRDIGGWTGLNGKNIKYEWIYRCGSLNGEFYKKPSKNWLGQTVKYGIIEQTTPGNYTFGDPSRQQVLDLGIKSELDLRTTRQEENNDKADGIVHSWSLGQNNTGIDDWNFFHIKTSGATAPLTDYAVIKDVAWIINEVINEKRPVAFHCKSGADRTGMVGIALESLLGVNPGDIAREYELTNFSSEMPKIEDKKELRDRRADGKANTEAFSFHNEIFKNDKSNPGTNYQEKMYYYLNKKFANIGVAISSSDLDNFIKFMLGLSNYSHPSWATENGNTLESVYNHQ